MQVTESVRMAIGAIQANKLRAGLTLLSISIGVFAIVGVAAAVGALTASIDKQLESLGRSTFIIQRDPAFEMGGAGDRRPQLTLRQAMDFKSRFTAAENISLTNFIGGVVIKFEEKSSDPTFFIVGGDESYLPTNDYTIEEGRGIDPMDVQNGTDVVVIAADIANKFFSQRSAIGKQIKLNGYPYTVIGVLQSKGAMFGQSQDNFVLIPITSAARRFFDEWGSSVSMAIRAPSIEKLEETMDQAIGLMRIIRRLDIGEENDFEIITNESLSETFGGITKYVSWFGAICGGFALLAAGVGIMNIMLVSVKERTREIGIRKAIGATSGNILVQFIIESVTLCQLGALIGIGIGVGMGLAVGGLLGIVAPIPWGSVGISVGICLFIGVVFGSFPAWKASQLDPIEALRYE